MNPRTNLRGIVAMLLATALFSLMDTGLKLLAPHYPALQVAALRALSSLPLVIAFVAWRGAFGTLLRIRWPLHLLRGAIGIGMLALFTFALLTATLLASATSLAAAPAKSGFESIEPVYVPGGQYTATLDQTQNVWRFLPMNGQDVVIDAGRCATGAMAPVGVWLLQLDARGRPELVAPSVTRLPAGAPDHIALRACDQARGRELAVPQTVLDLLAANTGAVYVAR